MTFIHNDPITLFVQCLVDGIYPEVAHSVVKLFKRLDLRFSIPDNQTCCGQPVYNSGYHKLARKTAKHFINVFEESNIIVCPSGSCVDMVRHHYPSLFKDNSTWLKRAQAVSDKTFELTEYLVDILKLTDVGSTFQGRVTYHESCHLSRRLGVSVQPRALIQHVPGADLVEMKDAGRCCGFGGAFSMKYPDISSSILEDKVENIIQSGASTVIGCDISCLMNIQGMLSRRKSDIKALHIAQVLAE